jgi:hypothetical protein
MRTRLLFSSLCAAMSLLSISSAFASELTVSVEVPTLDVAEYHKPYVSVSRPKK